MAFIIVSVEIKKKWLWHIYSAIVLVFKIQLKYSYCDETIVNLWLL